MSKAIIISGYLHNLSDNIIPFLDDSTDVYVHSWKGNDNERWIHKLNRYKKFCRKLFVNIEDPLYEKKLFSYFYSTWQSVNSIKDIDSYELIVKFKPNLDTDTIIYGSNLKEYYNQAYLQSYPLLKNILPSECFYGSIYHETMDERLFFGYPLAFKKVFHILYKELDSYMIELDKRLQLEFNDRYEGSIFWKNFIENKGVKLIQNTELKLPNNIQWQNQ